MIEIFNGNNSGMMSIWKFLDWNKPEWAKTKYAYLDFWEVGKYNLYKELFIGKSGNGCANLNLFNAYRDANSQKYVLIMDIGDLMGELMDISTQYNLYKVSVRTDGYLTGNYRVWICKVEPNQDYNIDADMVERFCNKVFEK